MLYHLSIFWQRVQWTAQANIISVRTYLNLRAEQFSKFPMCSVKLILTFFLKY